MDIEAKKDCLIGVMKGGAYSRISEERWLVAGLQNAERVFG